MAGIFVFRNRRSLLWTVDENKIRLSEARDLIDLVAPSSRDHAIILLSPAVKFQNALIPCKSLIMQFFLFGTTLNDSSETKFLVSNSVSSFSLKIYSPGSSTFSLLFLIKKAKSIANGTAPIYLCIIIDGHITELTTKHHTLPDKWNSVAQKVSGTNEK